MNTTADILAFRNHNADRSARTSRGWRDSAVPARVRALWSEHEGVR